MLNATSPLSELRKALALRTSLSGFSGSMPQSLMDNMGTSTKKESSFAQQLGRSGMAGNPDERASAQNSTDPQRGQSWTQRQARRESASAEPQIERQVLERRESRQDRDIESYKEKSPHKKSNIPEPQTEASSYFYDGHVDFQGKVPHTTPGEDTPIKDLRHTLRPGYGRDSLGTAFPALQPAAAEHMPAAFPARGSRFPESPLGEGAAPQELNRGLIQEAFPTATPGKNDLAPFLSRAEGLLGKDFLGKDLRSLFSGEGFSLASQWGRELLGGQRAPQLVGMGHLESPSPFQQEANGLPATPEAFDDPFQGKLLDLEGFSVESVELEGPSGTEKWAHGSLEGKNGFFKTSQFSSSWSHQQGQGAEGNAFAEEALPQELKKAGEMKGLGLSSEGKSAHKDSPSLFGEQNADKAKGLQASSTGWKQEQAVQTRNGGALHPEAAALSPKSLEAARDVNVRLQNHRGQGGHPPLELPQDARPQDKAGFTRNQHAVASPQQRQQVAPQEFKQQGSFQNQEGNRDGMEALGKTERARPHTLARGDKQVPRFLRHGTFERITHLAERLQSQGGGRARVSIQDKDFGQIKMEIQISSDRQIFVELQSESQELKNVIKQGQGELEKSLQNINLRLGDLRVAAVDGSQQAGSSASDGQPSQNQQQSFSGEGSPKNFQSSQGGAGERFQQDRGSSEHSSSLEPLPRKQGPPGNVWSKKAGSHSKGSVSVSV